MQDMNAESIQKILDIAAPTTFFLKDVNGTETQFANKPLVQVLAKAPDQPDSVKVHTLAGFAALIEAKLEDKDFPKDFLIHVQNERSIVLVDRLSDRYGRRLDLIHAEPVPFKQFTFGQWLNQEEFAIAVASQFAESPDKNYVLNLASTLTNEGLMTSEDDGFTQKATTKAGLRLKTDITIRPRVDLAPYRTFPEIDQVVSSFVLRARCDGQTPMLMLVEADGGKWKLEAIDRIAMAMMQFQTAIPIIA